MDQYIINGGNPLIGEITVGGSKNSALPIFAAAILTDEDVIISNVPDISDVEIISLAIQEIGARVTRIDDHTIRINGKDVRPLQVDNEYIRKIRASYYLIGALLGRFKKANVVLPGGCNIGNRPIDQHLKGFHKLGADVRIVGGNVVAETRKLQGAHIFLDMASVGATINLMLAAVLAEGQTVIETAAKEPHVVDVANFLNSMGARIKGAGTDTIRINGVEKLHGTRYTIIPDQIEAGTFMIAAAATGGDVTIKGVIPKHMEAVTAKLSDMGISVEEGDDYVRVVAGGDRPRFTNIKTMPYPGYPTDLQPQITALASISQGTSVIMEEVFDARFKFVDELVRMGATIRTDKTTAVVDGVEELTGATVSAPDLRGCAALVIAGLVARGTTVIENMNFIERGYEKFAEKIVSLGGSIIKADSEEYKKIEQHKNRVV